MILGIHHIGISVPDLQKAVAFYCGVLGGVDMWGRDLDPVTANADAVIGLKDVRASFRIVKLGNAYLELWEFANPKPRPLPFDHPPSDHGIAHICLQVSDIHAEHARLSDAGMTFVGPPRDSGTMAAVYGRDPFGNIVEIYEIRDNSMPGIG